MKVYIKGAEDLNIIDLQFKIFFQGIFFNVFLHWLCWSLQGCDVYYKLFTLAASMELRRQERERGGCRERKNEGILTVAVWSHLVLISS